MNEEFGAALLEPDAPLPVGVTGPRGKKAVKRFAVYRNNVIVSLINALAEIFPAIRVLLGEKSFADLARIFITRHQPTSPLLFEYGDELPGFLADFKPLAAFPFLPDLARLERVWLKSFHAADATVLDLTIFSTTAEDRVGELVFCAHPATALVESDFAIVSLMTLSREDQPLDGVDPGARQTALVTRPADNVEVRELPIGGAKFFRCLLDGQSLADSADAAVAIDTQFNLPVAITALIQSGAFTSASTDPAQSPKGEAI